MRANLDLDESSGEVKFYAAQLDMDLFQDGYDTLLSRSLQDIEFGTDFISGRIEAGPAQMLFTSIPFDPGWHALVDGEEVEVTSLGESFLTVPLPEGEHEILLEYRLPGWQLGLIVSAVSFALLLLALFLRPRISRALALQAQLLEHEAEADEAPEPQAALSPPTPGGQEADGQAPDGQAPDGQTPDASYCSA